MAAQETALPPIPLPRRLDRRMRLGPFPSAREAMRFAGYAALGTGLLPVGGATAWLPALGLAFFLAVYRPDGKGLDDRVGDYVRYRWRRQRRAGPTGPRRPGGVGTVLRLPGPFVAGVLETGGVPIRFLPPADARTLFEGYRDLLRATEDGFVLDVDSVPNGPAPRLPSAELSHGPEERAAREGYSTMLERLLERRSRRRVRIVLFQPLQGAGSIGRLESRLSALSGHLSGLGLASVRLTGAELERAATAIGWTVEGGG